MKVLFICKSNAERSQVAQTLFNALSRKNTAISAGVNVERENYVGLPPGRRISELLLDLGYDIRGNVRKQLTQELLEKVDMAVVILSRQEIERYLPDYMSKSKKVRFWRISMSPTNTDIEERASVVIEIKNRVEDLVKEVG